MISLFNLCFPQGKIDYKKFRPWLAIWQDKYIKAYDRPRLINFVSERLGFISEPTQNS